MLVLIVSLLGEHFPFDNLREENSVLTPDLNSVSEVLHFSCSQRTY